MYRQTETHFSLLLSFLMKTLTWFGRIRYGSAALTSLIGAGGFSADKGLCNYTGTRRRRDLPHADRRDNTGSALGFPST